jgi:formiminotetrahydrofolate cyclodeaminase
MAKLRLGSDKVNIEEIKKMVDEAVPSLENAPELRYLLSIIEQAEKAFEDVINIYSLFKDESTGMKIIAEEALQAIRGNKINECNHEYALIPPNEIITSHYKMCKKCHDVNWDIGDFVE